MNPLAQLEAGFFRQLNRIVEPLLRVGLGSPGPCASGVILLETTGRKSGRTISVPLMATALGELVIVSTMRGSRSQWLRNLAARPDVRYWAHGRPREAAAIVIAGDEPDRDGRPLPAPVQMLISLLSSFATGDFAFAVLMPAA